MTITDIDRLNIHIKLLTSRLDALEEMVRKDKPAPAPQRDTSWHPYDYRVDQRPLPNDARVVVMIRGSDEIQPMQRADEWNWGEYGCNTIIAWRYAKEGE